MNQQREIKIFASVEDLNEYAAEEFVRLSREAIQERGRFTVALSGGSTPKKLYALLASDKHRAAVEWDKIQCFFGDERFVAPDAEDSNYRMANEALFSKIEMPAENIHRFLTETGDAKSVAEKMADTLNKVFDLFASEFPRFDLIFLGMGDDGHTASLFPETEALAETQKAVVENYVPKLETLRLTFTFSTINNARNVIFLIAGEDKAEVLKEVLTSETKKYPSQAIAPSDGKLKFLLDKKAASLLKIKTEKPFQNDVNLLETT